MRFLFLFLFLNLHATYALAEWSFAPDGNWVSQTPTALGVSVRGVHALSLTCVDGRPFAYTQGYPAKPGDNRQASFTVVVEGQSYRVTGEHSPPDGLWTGFAPPGMAAALKRGRVADVTPQGAETQRYSLKGSSKAISAALANCDSASGSAKPGGKIVLMGQMIAAACGGGYALADGHEFTALIDGDDKPDIILDWAGVTCDDRSKGRGAGRCGAAMCSITVAFTQTQSIQDLLGVKPQIVTRAFGRLALRTVQVSRTCLKPSCEVDWRWNGSKLEPAP